MYPVRDGFLYGLAAAREQLHGMTGADAAAFLRARWKKPNDDIARMAAACEANPTPFYAEIRDCRSPRWVNGRVALVGDAACAFLPTAGYGSTMALLSSRALAGAIAGVPADAIPDALSKYEFDQKPLTEKAHEQSRLLGNAMFGSRTETYAPLESARAAVQLMTDIA
jgi:2-polyprenyl-6-methoxyphenol hydroxylase-like FAD-dependent oxidoreductase